jgi:hypothetical protein
MQNHIDNNLQSWFMQAQNKDPRDNRLFQLCDYLEIDILWPYRSNPSNLIDSVIWFAGKKPNERQAAL